MTFKFRFFEIFQFDDKNLIGIKFFKGFVKNQNIVLGVFTRNLNKYFGKKIIIFWKFVKV